ncbi:hypothetical protein BDR05DRAFT_968880 [Suillus weaverae]|nr:hypothetical protein BDR05DRAFT_968880 [Suillus weaverae]
MNWKQQLYGEFGTEFSPKGQNPAICINLLGVSCNSRDPLTRVIDLNNPR